MIYMMSKNRDIVRIEKNLKEKLERPAQKFRQEEKYTIMIPFFLDQT